MPLQCTSRSALSGGKALHVSCIISVQCLSFTHPCDIICFYLPCDPLELNQSITWKYNLRASWDCSGDAEGRISIAELLCVLREQIKVKFEYQLLDKFSKPILRKITMLFLRISDWKSDAMTTGHHHVASAELLLWLRLFFKIVFLFRSWVSTTYLCLYTHLCIFLATKCLCIFRNATPANDNQHTHTSYFVYWIFSLHPSWMYNTWIVRTNSWKQYSKQNYISLITFFFIKVLMAFSTFEIGSGIIQSFKCHLKSHRQDTIFVLFLRKLMI